MCVSMETIRDKYYLITEADIHFVSHMCQTVSHFDTTASCATTDFFLHSLFDNTNTKIKTTVMSSK